MDFNNFIKRNHNLQIEIEGMFCGSLTEYENNFGYLSDFSDEELIEYAKSDAKEWGCSFKISNKGEV